MIEDIWKQPAKGFTEETLGRTEEQIVQKESEIGFKFPSLYREHMKIQNGGYLWKSAIIYQETVKELLYNGATLDKISDHKGYKTLKDVLLEYKDKEELESLSESEFIDLDRLPILSHMDGHTILCFDYGYNVESEYETPQIVHFELECAENGFEEKLRITSYDDLINNLVYYGYESTSFYIGLKSDKSINTIVDQVSKTLEVELVERTDDGYGWYNFNKWYYGKLNINSSLSAHLKITSNQFQSNTYLFQNRKDFNYIIDIDIRIGLDSFINNSKFIESIIKDSFQSLLSNFNWDFLLVPYHVDNAEELDKLKKATQVKSEFSENNLKVKLTKNSDRDSEKSEVREDKKRNPWWKRLWS